MSVPAVGQKKLQDKKHWFFLVGICGLSIALELYSRSGGFILTSDSYQYLSAAQSFSRQGNFLCDDGTYYAHWQPLFPIILSITSKPVMLLTWLNIAGKIILVVALSKIADEFLNNSAIKTVFVLLSMCCAATIMISVFVWSDFLFMTLAFANLVFAFHVHKRNYFSYLIVTGFLMCIQRNAGLFWVGGICLWMLFDTTIPIFKNVVRVAFFFLTTTIGLWAWNIYTTFFLPSNFSFYKKPFLLGWWYNWKLIGEVFSKQFVPVGNWMFAVFGVIILVTVLRNNFDRKLSLVACIVFVYAVGFACMGKLDHHEMERYFSGIFPLAFLSVLLAVEKVMHNTPGKVRYAIVILTCLWALYPITRTFKNVQFWHERSCLTDSSI